MVHMYAKVFYLIFYSVKFYIFSCIKVTFFFMQPNYQPKSIKLPVLQNILRRKVIESCFESGRCVNSLTSKLRVFTFFFS